MLAYLIEELGDVLDNVFIIADKYDISLESITVESGKINFAL